MLITRLVFETETPLHCGGGVDVLQDQPVTRDAFGFWRLPGSSVAGILRSWLRQRNRGMEKALFGEHDGEKSSASIVWCNDAVLLDYDGEPAAAKVCAGRETRVPVGPFVRDHVRLDMERGCAVQGGKFDEEIVPPGARFALEIVLDGWDAKPAPAQEDAFVAMSAALAAGNVRLGGKLASGYGRIRCVSASCRRYDIDSEQGLTDWLNLAPSPVRELEGGEAVSLTGADSALQGSGLDFSMVLPLQSCGPILVGGVNGRDDADIVCLLTPCLHYEKGAEQYRYTLPGSSFRGALRHRVHAIAGALGLDADAQVDSIFGTVKGKNARAGKLSVDDVYLDAQGAQVVQHVAIDRFSGGVLDGALFNEAPVWKNDLAVPLRIEGRDLAPVEAKLVLHALLDLATGTLPIGSGTNRGNGILRLRNLHRGWQVALEGVTCSALWDGEAFEAGLADKWLDKLEEAGR